MAERIKDLLADGASLLPAPAPGPLAECARPPAVENVVGLIKAAERVNRAWTSGQTFLLNERPNSRAAVATRTSARSSPESREGCDLHSPRRRAPRHLRPTSASLPPTKYSREDAADRRAPPIARVSVVGECFLDRLSSCGGFAEMLLMDCRLDLQGALVWL